MEQGGEQEVGTGEPGTSVRRGEGGSQPTRGSLHEYVKNSSAASSSRPVDGGGPDRGERVARGDGGGHVGARVGVHG